MSIHIRMLRNLSGDSRADRDLPTLDPQHQNVATYALCVDHEDSGDEAK